MTIGGFLLGFFLVLIGFLMVWRRQDFRNYLGDLGTMFDMPGSSLLSWEVLGAASMVLGFLLAFGVLGSFLQKILHSFASPTIG